MPIIKNMDLASAVAVVERLRMIADHIEQGGPAVYLSGGVAVNLNRDSHEHAFGRVAGTQTIELQSDLTLRGVPWYAPQQGIKMFLANDGAFYRWNGEPPRPPKKGEFYCIGDEVKCAPRDLKRPRYIVQESP